MAHIGHSGRRAVTSSSRASVVTPHLARFTPATPDLSWTQLIATSKSQCKLIQGRSGSAVKVKMSVRGI